METKEQTWKERKADLDAEINRKLHRVFLIRDPKPGDVVQTITGTRYVIDQHGARRRA